MITPILVRKDPYLKPFTNQIIERARRAIDKENKLCGHKSLIDFANGYLYYGLHKTNDSWIYRDKMPNVHKAYLVGSFSDWNGQEQFRLTKVSNTDFEGIFPLKSIKHGDQYRLKIYFDNKVEYRIPAYARRVVDTSGTGHFNAEVYDPSDKYQFQHPNPPFNRNYILIYEAHIGMSSEEEKISTFDEFRRNILPRIHKAGYDTIQLMAIQEHPYYGSFGYHVSSFYAVTSRFGTPDDLKRLIDEAHSLGIRVIMDLVHSHAVKNTVEGISMYDGTDYLYFHSGDRGNHPAWDSRCFDYGKDETLHFLLSNIKYWLTEFRFDGFRFDGVTSMIYLNHGLGTDFVDYSMYYNDNIDEDAIVYLTLANKLVKQVNKEAITIAEEMSGLPGLCEKPDNDGVGFDFRLAMGTPDFWIKIIQKPDEDWHIGDILYNLTNKRAEEKTINYVESHDQALVGDKTLIFRLADKEMYYNMHLSKINIVVQRAIDLHKIIRFITLVTAPNGYLNFMGNEFGHPEWIDFPRLGNNWSYKYARRQWSLCDNDQLAYYYLNLFDNDMIEFVRKNKILDTFEIKDVHYDVENQILIFTRQSHIFVFNFNPTKSIPGYCFVVPEGTYRIVFNSDNARYLGFNRIDEQMDYPAVLNTSTGNYELRIYSVNRSVFVLRNKNYSMSK